ncbi:unnamed protein product [Staurois parvus]|uniref:Uncharacterized protein n=1 Tax=Staurois parvus TaxID=386267 RepID=A0ABN9HMG4_9NEOB|nr:unnamed protein product [Staurois parvus]
MGPPTDPRPSGIARVSKWSVRPWYILSDTSISFALYQIIIIL